MTYPNYIITFCWKYWGFTDQNKIILWECLGEALSSHGSDIKIRIKLSSKWLLWSVHPLTKWCTLTLPWALAGKELSVCSAAPSPSHHSGSSLQLLHTSLCLPSTATRQRINPWLLLPHKSQQCPSEWCSLTKYVQSSCSKCAIFNSFSTLKRNFDFSFNMKQYNYNQLFFDNCSIYSTIIYLSEYWLYCNFHLSRFTRVSQLSHIRLHSTEW